MCELVIIAAVFAVAIEIRCGELFNDRKINVSTTQQLRPTDGNLYRCDCRNSVDSYKDLPVFCRRECKGEASEKADTAGN